jgi:hypothetical protein
MLQSRGPWAPRDRIVAGIFGTRHPIEGPLTPPARDIHGLEEVIMAIGLQAEFQGATLEQYDEITERLGRLPGAPSPRGQLFHFVTGTDEGFRVVDVWESEEAFQHYFNETIEPVFGEVGIKVAPVIEIFPVHNYSIGARRLSHR